MASDEKSPKSEKLLAKVKVKKKPSLQDPQPVIKVIIGPDKTTFLVHKDFLCYYSPYFAGALREGAFKESETQTVELDHADVEAFGLLVTWLYTQKIPITISPLPKGGKDDDDDKPSWNALVHLWILADYLQIPMLQNSAMDEVLRKQERLEKLPSETFLIIYENTGPGSFLRKVMVDLIVWRGLEDSTYFAKKHNEFPKDMLIEMATAWTSKSNEMDIVDIEDLLDDSKNYHVKTGVGGVDDVKE